MERVFLQSHTHALNTSDRDSRSLIAHSLSLTQNFSSSFSKTSSSDRLVAALFEKLKTHTLTPPQPRLLLHSFSIFSRYFFFFFSSDSLSPFIHAHDRREGARLHRWQLSYFSSSSPSSLLPPGLIRYLSIKNTC